MYNQYTVGIQSVYNQYTVGIQSVYNRYTVSIQSVYSQYTVSVQSVYSQYTVSIQAFITDMTTRNGHCSCTSCSGSVGCTSCSGSVGCTSCSGSSGKHTNLLLSLWRGVTCNPCYMHDIQKLSLLCVQHVHQWYSNHWCTWHMNGLGYCVAHQLDRD